MISKKLLVLLSLGVAVIGSFAQGLGSLKINEVVVSNTNGLTNEVGERTGWIEIENTSWSSQNIGGCYITNDPSVLDESLSAPERIAKMSKIERGDARTTIAPKNHFVIFTDGHISLGTLHTNFTLTPGQKNFIALYEANGTKLLDKIEIPATLPQNASYARFVDENGQNPEWRVCDSTSVTPATQNKLEKREDKVAEWKEKDPSGIAMTILSMGIVLSGLFLLYIFFMIFGKIARSLNEKKAQDTTATQSEEPAAVANSTKKSDDIDTIMVVIGMALYEMEQDAHDDESGVITILPTQSPWVSRAMEIAKRTN